MSSLQKCLFRSIAHFLIRLFWVIWILYIFWTLTLPLDTWFENVLSHLIGCFFTLLIGFVGLSVLVFCFWWWWFFVCFYLFALQKHFYLINHQLPVLLMSYPWNQCQDQCQDNFPACFLLLVLQLQVLDLNNIWVDIVYVWDMPVSTFFPACRYPAFPILFIEEVVLFHCVFSAPCQISVDNKCIDLFLGSLFCFIGTSTILFRYIIAFNIFWNQ